MEVKIGSNSLIRDINYDSKLCLTLGASGITIPLMVLPSFEVDIFIENRESEKVHCTFNGSTATNCTITTDGEITCYMPAYTFSVGGKLFIKVITHTPDTNFADGSYDESITIDTKYLMQ
jgi:hypothetical protein